MGKNIKRLSLALLALGLSAPAFADTCCAPSVTIPVQQGGFSIGADALYWKPSVSNDAYVSTTSLSTTGAVFNNSIKTIDPDYQWGFDITAAYRIPCTGNDISATWTHLGNNNDNTDTVAIPSAIGTDFVSGDLNLNNYDAVDVDFGQRVNFGSNFNFRVFTGLRWAQVQEDVGYTVRSNDVAGTTAALFHVQDNSKFDGIGPQFGIDGRYCLGYGFGLDANLTTSLLIGSIDASTDQNFTVAGVGTIGSDTDLGNKNSHVVPAVDASLGLDYTYNFNNCDRSSLVIQAGWKVVNYWDVSHDMFANGDHTIDGTTGFAGFPGGLFPNNASNVAFQGPYAGIKVNL